MGLETLAAASAIVAAAGTGLSIAGANESASQMNKAADSELARQSQFQKQATSLFQNSLAQSTPATSQKQIGQGTEQALAELSKVTSQPLGNAVPAATATTGNVIGTNEQGARSGLLNRAVAPNLGYSNFSLQQAIQNALFQQRQALIGAQSGASAGVLPLELQQGQQAGQTLSGLGSLLSSAGYLGGIYGATRPAPKPASPAPSPWMTIPSM